MAKTFTKVMPMLDRVLVQRSETALISKGGIVIPDKNMEKSLEGTVVATGPGARNPETGKFIPIGIKAGDRVLLPEYGGARVEMETDHKEYLLFRESEILAKVE